MRAMILAAGKGERMLPLTQTTPKPLLQVRGRPLIAHHLLSLAKHGITEVVINVHYLGEKIVAELGDGSAYGLQIKYSKEEQLLNTGGGIVQALSKLGEEPFIVLSSDIFTDFSFANLPKNPVGHAHIVLVDNPDYNLRGDFALCDGKVSLDSAQKLTYANIGVIRPELFINAPQGPFGLGDLLRSSARAGLVTGEYFSGQWHNVGTPEELVMVNALV